MAKLDYDIVLIFHKQMIPKIDISSQINAAANIGSNKTALMSVDTNLDECIKALDSGNTTLASEHCKWLIRLWRHSHENKIAIVASVNVNAARH